jgi:hypothetical protein
MRLGQNKTRTTIGRVSKIFWSVLRVSKFQKKKKKQQQKAEA